MKQEKTISKKIEPYSKYWPPEDAPGFLAWLLAELDAVPKEYRDTVRIELGSEESYGSSSATLEFSYVRPETDEEEAKREQLAAYDIARRQAAELRTLAELQAKYSKLAAF